MVRNIYELAGEAIEREKTYFGIFRDSPDVVLTRSIEVLSMFVEVLRKLRQVGESSAQRFRSDGFQTLFEMLQRELSDDYFETVSRHLQRLKFPEGVLVSARLGAGNKGTGYTLREPRRISACGPFVCYRSDWKDIHYMCILAMKRAGGRFRTCATEV